MWQRALSCAVAAVIILGFAAVLLVVGLSVRDLG